MDKSMINHQQKLDEKLDLPVFNYGYRKCMSEVEFLERVQWYPKCIDC